MVNKVRGKLSKLERKTLSALIVIDVHARDTVVELAKADISSETDFEWMSQLRYVCNVTIYGNYNSTWHIPVTLVLISAVKYLLYC